MFRNKEIRLLGLVFVLVAAASTAGCFAFSLPAGACCLAGFCIFGLTVFVFTHRRYQKIAELSEMLTKTVNGHHRFVIEDVSEGELSILQSEIYKLASKLTEQAELLSREKDAMAGALSDISHQLKTPLTSLVMLADLLEDGALPPEKRDEFMQNLKTGLARMEWLILSLLKIAKLDSGTIQMDCAEHKIYEVVNLAQKALLLLLESKNQLLRLEGDKSLTVVCDLNWMVEAFSNILKNAIEHSPAGGHICLSWGQNPICTWISVLDSGGGIAVKDMPHLFKRFYKGEKSEKNNVGIGLALALSIVQKQNGDIEIYNREEYGAEFVIKIFRTDLLQVKVTELSPNKSL